MGSLRMAKSLPLQVAAICYRKRGDAVEFLLVNTNGGNKWTFPKGITGSPPLAQSGRRTRSRGRGRRWAPSSLATFISTFTPRACSGSRAACRSLW